MVNKDKQLGYLTMRYWGVRELKRDLSVARIS